MLEKDSFFLLQRTIPLCYQTGRKQNSLWLQSNTTICVCICVYIYIYIYIYIDNMLRPISVRKAAINSHITLLRYAQFFVLLLLYCILCFICGDFAKCLYF